jgi:hypothetical protein
MVALPEPNKQSSCFTFPTWRSAPHPVHTWTTKGCRLSSARAASPRISQVQSTSREDLITNPTSQLPTTSHLECKWHRHLPFKPAVTRMLGYSCAATCSMDKQTNTKPRMSSHNSCLWNQEPQRWHTNITTTYIVNRRIWFHVVVVFFFSRITPLLNRA